MKSFIITLIILTTSFGLARENDELREELRCEQQRIIEELDTELMNFPKFMLAFLMNKAAKGAMTDTMLEYFTNDLEASLIFMNAVQFAKKNSKDFCRVPEGEKRHTDDEVDAVRHFLWASYLTYHLDPKRASEILAMQEDRSEYLGERELMDLYNNKQGQLFAIELKKKRTSRRMRRMHRFSKSTLRKEVFKRVKNGSLMVIESKNSFCQNKLVYPNY